MTTQQPDALRLAAMLTADEWPGSVTLVSYARECVAELLRQHARITALESQLAQRFDAAAASAGWISVDERLPEPGMPVLLDIGKKYPIRAMWAAKHTVQAADDDTDRGEYVEEDDMYYAPEGWYEWNQCEDNHWRVTETPRAWMPLPPTSAEGVEP